MKGIWIAVVGATLIAGDALAEDKPAVSGNAAVSATAPAPAARKPRHSKYGAAGCGLGSIIISGGGIVQIFAATTNGTSANQTFAITSGTSNCDDAEAGEDSARVFVHANREALAKDISRGSGETLEDLAAIAGCADPKAVAVRLQQSFKTIFPNASVSSDEVTDSILATLKSDSLLACSAVGG